MEKRKPSLVRKFIMICAAIFIIVLLALASQIYTAREIILERTSKALSAAHLQAFDSIKYFQENIGNAAFALSYSPTIQQLLKPISDIDRVLMSNDVNSVFSSTSLLQENIIGISVFDKNGFYITSNGQVVSQTYLNVEEIAMLPDGLYSSLSPDVEEHRLGRKSYTISYPIYSLKINRLLGQLLGAVMFTMSTDNIRNILSNIENYEGGVSVLEDGGGNFITGSSQTAEDLFLSEKWQNEHAYLTLSSRFSGSGWMLVSLVSKGQLQRDLLPILWISGITGAAIMLLLASFMFLLYRKILTPIQSLSGFMHTVSASESGARYPQGDLRDELGLMALSMNKMLDSLEGKNTELRRRETQVLEADIARKEMEILAYRNQVSPHFLYNTLDCIRGIALYRNAPEIVRISQSLSKMFRYAVQGENFASVAEEVNHTKEYATIIGYRFQNRIRIDFDAEEDALRCRTLKMTLQPLVENAVLHGLEKCVGTGIISVCVYIKNEQLHLSVKDNGIGIPSEQLDTLKRTLAMDPNALPDGEKGVGLMNIARRLKLFYQANSSIAIESKENAGTLIQISIPMQKEADTPCTPLSSQTTSLG